jgi:SAM-dependent methyltransferase
MSVAKSALSPFYSLLERSGFYALGQFVGRPTTDRFRRLLARNLAAGVDTSILDLGCGIGNYRDCFVGRYTGIDINPAYVASARAALPGRFETMDCTRLGFSDGTFDEVVTIATTHHLDDAQVAQMVVEALRTCRRGGHLHIIDAILPVAPNFAIKRFWFNLDRGEFPRPLDKLLACVARGGAIVRHEVLTGPLHDTVYIRVGHR